MSNRLRRIDVEREVLRAVNDGLSTAVPLQGLSKDSVKSWLVKNNDISSSTLQVVELRVAELSKLISASFEESGQAIFERLEDCEPEIDKLLRALAEDLRV